MERDNKWLKNRFAILWQRYFPDVKIANNVLVKFGRPTRTRLGSIKFGRHAKRGIWDDSASRRVEDPNTIITINGFFMDPEIPDFVVDGVLAHELTHYTHGFFSPHEQYHRYPHQGGVVRREMVDRGLKDLLQLEKRWIKENWVKYLKGKGEIC